MLEFVLPSVESHRPYLIESFSRNSIGFHGNGVFRLIQAGEKCGKEQTEQPFRNAKLADQLLGTHTGREVLVIRLQSGGGNLPFTMHSFANVGAEDIKFRYKAGDGQWYQWNSMAGNTIWDVSAYVVNVTEVQITNAGTSFSCGVDWEAGGPGGCMIDYQAFFVDDFSISP